MHVINYSHKQTALCFKNVKGTLLQLNSNLKISKDFLCYIKILVIPMEKK